MTESERTHHALEWTRDGDRGPLDVLRSPQAELLVQLRLCRRIRIEPRNAIIVGR